MAFGASTRWACLLFLICRSSALLIFQNSSSDQTEYLYGLFDTPYASIPAEGMTGHLYYHEGCDDLVPPPSTNQSILLVDEMCILKSIALAKQAGYDGLLSFSANDTNTSVSDAMVRTGFPVAIITWDLALQIREDIGIETNETGGMFTGYTATITGSIIAGILIVSFSCFFMLCLFCCSVIWTSVCCCICLNRCQEQRENEQLFAANGYRSREELVESILRHLEEMGNEYSGRIPLGPEATKNIPVKKYSSKREKEESCAICVDEFADGDQIKKLPCNHIFHAVCINEWLGNHSCLCPLCKFDLRNRVGTHPLPPPSSSPSLVSATISSDRRSFSEGNLSNSNISLYGST